MSSKITILMPTYNDAEYIGASIESVVSQTYRNWELLIMDDGSTDQTADVVRSFAQRLPERVFLFRQNNVGQLNAILNLAHRISGDYVTLLHSDDVLLSPNALSEIVSFAKKTAADGVYSDLVAINEKGERTGKRRTFFSIKQLVISGGSNCTSDFFLVNRGAFFRYVKDNYLLWNIPYYLTMSYGRIDLPKLVKHSHPWYGYRVYGGNYARSPVGLFVEINGTLRTIETFYMSSMLIKPAFILRKRIFRSVLLGAYRLFPNIAERACVMCHAESPQQSLEQLERLLNLERSTIYTRTTEMRIREYVERVIASIGDLRRQLDAKNPSRPLVVQNLQLRGIPDYFGKDSSVFYKEMEESALPPIVENLFLKDYDAVFCDCPEAMNRLARLMRFFNYLTPVIIEKSGTAVSRGGCWTSLGICPLSFDLDRNCQDTEGA